MKANELMIGDWVICTLGNTKEQVGELYETQVMLFYNDIYDYDEIEPIPLTAEILEKNGFRIDKEDTGNLEYYCLGEVGVETCVVVKKHALNALEDLDVIWSIYVEDFAIYDKIMYVHQLQHAMRLCGIEKEIII